MTTTALQRAASFFTPYRLAQRRGRTDRRELAHRIAAASVEPARGH